MTSKKSPNVYKSCPKMTSLQKLKILTPLQKLLKNGQIDCCQRLWKVTQSPINRPIWSHWLVCASFWQVSFEQLQRHANYLPTSAHIFHQNLEILLWSNDFQASFCVEKCWALFKGWTDQFPASFSFNVNLFKQHTHLVSCGGIQTQDHSSLLDRKWPGIWQGLNLTPPKSRGM